MCGINGIAFSNASGRAVNQRLLVNMRDTIAHRGPDDFGEFIDENIGLGHRRLSIVDVAHGHQPMVSNDGSRIIVYNGEIYDHLDSRDNLKSRGHRFQTNCDTETILHLYEEYGVNCLDHLRGMFAFAILDRRDRSLFVARDRLGIKPLYFVHDGQGNLFFASEIKSLLNAGAVKAELNYGCLPDQMANHGTSAEETLFRDVKRLLPGHFLIWRDGHIDIKKYWDISFEPKHQIKSDAESVDEWRELFRESVRLRLMADVPLGMFLSGGIDSSAICAMMAELVEEPIKTFSVGFSERSANEFHYARIVSDAFKTEHHEITITPEEFFDRLPALVWHEDEPIGFTASVPLYFVSKLAQKHVKVVLTGEGSDELLGGYGRYYSARLLLRHGGTYKRLMPDVLQRAIHNNIDLIPLNRRLKRTFLTREADIEDLYFDNFAVFPKEMQKELFTPQARDKIAEHDPFAQLNAILLRTDATGALDKLLYADTKTYLHELLMKQDQMSMAASIESRVPFLDHKLVEYTARLPEKFKIRGRETKWILRRAMKGLLPDQIINRSKLGFPVPFGNWLRNKFSYIIDEYVLSDRCIDRGIFDPTFVGEIVRRHYAGENHDERLWFLINFEIWNRQFIDAEVPEVATERGVLVA